LSDVGAKLSYPVSNGNYATTRILSEALGITTNLTISLILCVLAVHSLRVLLRIKTKNETYLQAIRRSVARLLTDPFFCASLGITLTLAFSPLVWWHYYTLAIIPALWLIIVSPKWSYIEFLGVVSIILTSGQLTIIFRLHSFEPYPVALGWIPLWLGLQAVITHRCSEPITIV
jgi:hypothetical protein